MESPEEPRRDSTVQEQTNHTDDARPPHVVSTSPDVRNRTQSTGQNTQADDGQLVGTLIKTEETSDRLDSPASQHSGQLNKDVFYEEQYVLDNEFEDGPKPEKESGGEMEQCCKCYVNGMNKMWLRTIVMLFWLICTGAGLGYGMEQFMDNTIFTIPIAPGTPSETATLAYIESFPEADAAQSVMVVVQPPAHATYTLLDNDHFERFTQRLNDTVYAYPPLQTDPDFVQGVVSYWSLMDVTPKVFHSEMHDVMSAVMTPDNSTSFVVINLHGAASNAPLQPALATFKRNGDFIKYLRDKLAGINPHNLDAKITGMPAFDVSINAAVESDMMRVESVAAPLAMVVLGIMLRNFRLLIIPLICMGASLASALLVMWPISMVYPVVIIAPAIVTTVVLALSVDYSLFLLSRFREETHRGAGRLLSVQRMMMFAGHTVLVSGTTLFVCFCTCLFFPITMLISIGLGSVIAVTSTMVVNLTFTPAALLCFHGFFSHSQCLGCACCCCRHCKAPCDKQSGGASKSTFQLRDPVQAPGPNALKDASNGMTQQLIEHIDERTPRGIWLDLGLCTQKFKYLIAFVLLLGAAPFGYFSLQMEMVHSYSFILPRTSDSYSAYSTVMSRFGASSLLMNEMLVRPRNGSTVIDRGFFNRSQEYISFLKAQLDGTEFQNTTFQGMMWSCYAGKALAYVHALASDIPPLADGCRIHFHTVDWALHDTWPDNVRDDIDFIAHVLGLTTDIKGGTRMVQKIAWDVAGSMLNGTQQATSIMVQIPKKMDVMGPKGGEWIEFMRTSIDKLHHKYGDTDDVFLCKGDVLFHDVVSLVFKLFPFVVAATLGVVFVLVGLFFCSVMVPLRSVLTVTFTLAWVYGFMILVFQYGILDFMHFDGLHSAGGCYWMAPVLSFPMIIGVALDYDIFLLTRILELRRTGLTEVGSIVSGLTMTGHIITAAGMIMAIAFAGLLLSSETAMNQISCLLVTAVLVDTFVVRSVLVPAVMGMLGRLNWFPQQLCPCACLKLVRATKNPYDEAFLARTHACCKCCHRRRKVYRK